MTWEHRGEENVPGNIWGILWKDLLGHSCPLNSYCVLSSMGGTMGEETEASNTYLIFLLLGHQTSQVTSWLLHNISSAYDSFSSALLGMSLYGRVQGSHETADQ